MAYVITPPRAHHILFGDATGGGHRFGAGKGRSEFPVDWTDHDILTSVLDVANDPLSTCVPGRLQRLKVRGVRRNIAIIVIVDPAKNEIITAFPG